MKALVYTQPHEVQLQDQPQPRIAAGRPECCRDGCGIVAVTADIETQRFLGPGLQQMPDGQADNVAFIESRDEYCKRAGQRSRTEALRQDAGARSPRQLEPQPDQINREFVQRGLVVLGQHLQLDR